MLLLKVLILSGVKKFVFAISECGLHIMVSEVLAECLRVFTHLCTTLKKGIECPHSSI